MNNHPNDDDLTDDEIHAAVMASVQELLNIAALAAELQATDESAEDIYNMCDLVAAYFGIQRAEMETIENSDGSWTTRVVEPHHTQKPPLKGSIRTRGKPQYRIVDKDTDPDID